MKMARVILFTNQMEAMSRFYGEVLGLKQVTSEKGWKNKKWGQPHIFSESPRGI